jgi:hypothetical protein
MGAQVKFIGCPGLVVLPGTSVFAAALPRPASRGMAGVFVPGNGWLAAHPLNSANAAAVLADCPC